MSVQNFASGTQDGTGAAINIEIGWQPDHMVVQNIEATDFARLEWYKGMDAANAIKTVTSTKSKITSLGLSLYAGSTSAQQGFTIGADTDVNVSGEALTWCAWRNSQ